ncbi:peptidylprolyl isomerase [Thalassotalea sediminis]|uniref:peptidylprolyl isomerase n=1 Tax=Thalassotalea sediminis TaxID=1759089 RepID=UPI0025725411|nr:peptidylprolyl isomerase [Thalassotalea sediminis]
MKKYLTPLVLTLGLSAASAQATIVEFQTSHGNFKVNLHDETTPKTVENFLNYVTEGKYDNTIIHRTVDDFVIQGGGAKFEGELPPEWIETNGTIENEPAYSNVKATISMAKQSGRINSASSQWFINLKDNSSTLDPVDVYGGGAYAVFGEVIEDGMNVVNAIAEVPRCDTGHGGFRELPMPDYEDQCGDADAVPGQENFVNIYQVVIYDATVSTDADLTSTKNTLYEKSLEQPKSSGSSGGSFSWFALLLCAFPLVFRKK